ncbi:hypothetical protein Zmor_014832 [Zophobas morio]|uniref:Uncharacterized protein n=1 Tax=Zophobas morio TaxID=2755281 RepID=A0AA38IFC2_9CUCU|nr:hypothetical protein Zmor_014832 [Zophobas morio]
MFRDLHDCYNEWGRATRIKNQKSDFIRHFFNRNVKNTKRASQHRAVSEITVWCSFPIKCRVCRYGNWCARTFASVVQHIRDHGTFNLKLTIVAVIGQKEEVGVSQDKVPGLEVADCPRCVIHCK